MDSTNATLSYSLVLPNGIRDASKIDEEFFNGLSPQSGVSQLQVPITVMSTIYNGKIIIITLKSNAGIIVHLNSDLPDDVAIGRTEGRKPRSFGDKVAVVIRLTWDGETTTKSSAELSNDIFVDMKQGFHDCSLGQLNIVMATAAPEHGIVNGVKDLTLTSSYEDIDLFYFDDIVRIELNEQGFPLDDFDHIMVVLPKAVDYYGNFAWGAVGGTWSVYYDYVASKLSLNMHELGHNYGLKHSGWHDDDGGDGAYGDYTCLMGKLDEKDSGFDLTKVCFNGPKSWQLNWYPETYKTVEPSKNKWRGELVRFKAYMTGQMTSSQRMIIKIQDEDEIDLYLMFYSAQDMTKDSEDWKDSVTVTSQEGPRKESWIEGFARVGDSFRQSNWGDSGNDLVVEVCYITTTVLSYSESPTYAYTLVYVDDGINNLSCTDLIVPTPFPTTSLPTPSPTKTPTLSPTSPDDELDCTDNEDKVIINVRTDNYPQETYWFLKQYRETTDKFFNVIKSGKKAYTDKNTLHTARACVKKNKCFRFVIKDTQGDGLCCYEGKGYWEIYQNGERLKKRNMQVTRKQKFEFGPC